MINIDNLMKTYSPFFIFFFKTVLLQHESTEDGLKQHKKTYMCSWECIIGFHAKVEVQGKDRQITKTEK